MQTKKKNHSQPPGKCHLHSDADRGTDKIACQGDALADGNLRWDGANEQLEILQRKGQDNPQLTQKRVPGLCLLGETGKGPLPQEGPGVTGFRPLHPPSRCLPDVC